MINLFVNYYKDRNQARQKELDFCLNKNLENSLLNVIVIESSNRMTYTNYFRIIKEYTKNQEEINVIANLDIFFDSSIGLTNNMEHNNLFALTRWDYSLKTGESVFFDRKDSQDCWIVKGHVTDVFGEIYLGHPGCDNRIAYEFLKAGWKVTNPSKSIKTYHVHSSGIRNYTTKDVTSPPYLTIEVTSL